MNTTISTKLTRHDAHTARPVWRRVAVDGVAGWLAATITVEVYAAAGRAAGLPMLAGAPGAHAAQPVTSANIAFGVFICTFWGTVLALVLTRLASRPARIFVRTAVLLTAVSLVSPFAAAHAALSTKMFLAGAHLLAAAIAIPMLSRRLPRLRRRDQKK